MALACASISLQLLIEIQGTAEHRPFNRAELGTLLDLAEKGNKELQAAQRAALSLD